MMPHYQIICYPWLVLNSAGLRFLGLLWGTFAVVVFFLVELPKIII